MCCLSLQTNALIIGYLGLIFNGFEFYFFKDVLHFSFCISLTRKLYLFIWKDHTLETPITIGVHPWVIFEKTFTLQFHSSSDVSSTCMGFMKWVKYTFFANWGCQMTDAVQINFLWGNLWNKKTSDFKLWATFKMSIFVYYISILIAITELCAAVFGHKDDAMWNLCAHGIDINVCDSWSWRFHGNAEY